MDFKAFLLTLLRDPEVIATLRDVVGPAPTERLPIEAVAKELGINPRVMKDEERRGRLRLERAGHQRVVERQGLERWLASRQPRAGESSSAAPRSSATSAISRTAARIRGAA